MALITVRFFKAMKDVFLIATWHVVYDILMLNRKFERGITERLKLELGE
jgi:hypothetical protein